METDNKETFIKKIKDIQNIMRKIENLNKKLSSIEDYKYIVKLSRVIIDNLRLIVIIMNNNNEFISDISIKNETTLLKDYFINYINGIFNNNEYIIEKYRKNIDATYEKWNKRILDSINSTPIKIVRL